MLSATQLTLILSGTLASALPTLTSVTSAIPTAIGQPVLQGLAIDPNLQRDSCISTTELVGGRVFWLCRDSIILKNQNLTAEITQGLFQGGAAGFVASTGSWSDQISSGSAPKLVPIPPNQGQTQITKNFNQQLTQYGGESLYNASLPYIYYEPDECNGIPAGSSQGNCNDGTRIPLWPDSPAIVTSVGSDGTVTMYEYIKVPHINDGLGTVDYYPPASLYKLTYTPGSDPHALPAINLVAERFFPRYAFAYGDFANTKSADGTTLYLFGQDSNANVGLARVAIGQQENINAYEYYYSNGTGWSSVQPNVNQTEAYASVPNFGGGTMYYSSYYKLYLWFAQEQGSGNPVLYLSAALTPEGPWTPQVQVASFPQGDSFAYSLAAHPEMSTSPNEIYVTYTEQVDYPGTSTTVYQLPLYKVTLSL